MTHKQQVLLLKPNAKHETMGFGKIKAHIITINMKQIGGGISQSRAWSNALFNLESKKQKKKTA